MVFINFLFIKESWKKKIDTVLTGNVVNIDWAPNQQNMISELSYDTEDWSNMLKIQLCHHRNKLHFKI